MREVSEMPIIEISEEEALTLLENYPDGPWVKKNLGRFLITNPEGPFSHTAIDNQDGHCWCEDFHTKEDAIRFLNGEDAEDIRKGETK